MSCPCAPCAEVRSGEACLAPTLKDWEQTTYAPLRPLRKRPPSSAPHPPGHAAQDIVALDEMMAKRAPDVDYHDDSKPIGQQHVRLLDGLPYRTADCRHYGGHIDAKNVFRDRVSERGRDHPARDGNDEHEDIEGDVPDAGADALPPF